MGTPDPAWRFNLLTLFAWTTWFGVVVFLAWNATWLFACVLSFLAAISLHTGVQLVRNRLNDREQRQGAIVVALGVVAILAIFSAAPSSAVFRPMVRRETERVANRIRHQLDADSQFANVHVAVVDNLPQPVVQISGSVASRRVAARLQTIVDEHQGAVRISTSLYYPER